MTQPRVYTRAYGLLQASATMALLIASLPAQAQE